MGRLTTRPQLLFLCQTLPFPPDGGVWIRTYNVLRLLARTFDVTALCFERCGSSNAATVHDIAEARRALRPFAAVEVFPIAQRHSRIKYVWDHVRSATLRRAYTTYVYESRPFRRRLDELLRTKPFDLIHVDSLDLARYLPACRGLPIVCVHHNVESALLERRASIEGSWWRSAYMRYQGRLTANVERRWCERVALNVVVSAADRALLTELAPGARTVAVPNGVDVDEFCPDATEGRGAAFVGGTSWFPNRDALDFFSGQIWPRVKAAKPDASARWVGSATADERQHYGGRGIELTGYVSDVRPYMRDAACHVVPLRAGGGTRLKILNSWAMGKAVVSTSIGCEGLAAADGDNILVRDDPEAFAAAVVDVLEDAGLRRRLGAAGRATAERLYSWDVVGRGMIDVYLGIANAGVSDSEAAFAAAANEPGYSVR